MTLNNIPSKSNSFHAFLEQLPKQRFWDGFDIYKWRGFWFHPDILEPTMALPSKFEARGDDVILASSIKVGTTWLKCLCLCIMGSQPSDKKDEDILTKASPHVLVPTIEAMVGEEDPFSFLSRMASPRLLHTHLPYSLIPDSIKKSNTKMVYITRNPKDTLVSMWYHMNTSVHGNDEKLAVPIEEAFEVFSNGVYLYGPFFDHVLEYYNESLKMPEKVLFLKYEDLKSDPKSQVKTLASFLGRPFAKEEEVDQMLWRCSLDRLKNLEVNKNGTNSLNGLPNSVFFRLGITGDYKNYLTPEMEERLNEITRKKLEGSGLDLL